jgi:hypothetical protein
VRPTALGEQVSAMVRSVLEKTLKANGYTTGNLKDRLTKQQATRVLTESRRIERRRRFAFSETMCFTMLGGKLQKTSSSWPHHYAQRILEDFYEAELMSNHPKSERSVYLDLMARV